MSGDLPDAWWAIQRIKDDVGRLRDDQAMMLRHLARLEQRVTAIEIEEEPIPDE